MILKHYLLLATLTLGICTTACKKDAVIQDDEPGSKPILISNITIVPTSIAMVKGGKLQVSASITPSNVSNDSLVWTSEDNSIASFDQEGKLVAHEVGTTTITATATDGSGKWDTCTVTVGGTAVTSIAISPKSHSMNEGNTKLLSATVLPNNATNSKVAWVSSDSGVVSVNQSGMMRARVAGSALVMAWAQDGSGVADTCTVTVTAIDPTSTASITESGGWFESAYVEWTGPSNATAYNVYYSGQGVTDKKIDNQLIRKYSNHFRADVLGLKAGSYTLKVVPVFDGTEGASPATVDVAVRAHDRGGFAHFNHSGVGAYNDDGTLKTGAQVIYVSAKTAKTVTCTVGGTAYTGLQTIVDAYAKSTSNTPISIRIIGKIEAADMDKFSSSAEGLQIKGKSSHSLMNITLEGVGNDAVIRGFGVLMRNCKSVELRNFAVMLCMDDCISLDTDNSNCWIHHIDFFYGKTGSAADQVKGDGSLDCKGDSKYLTFSYNHFWDSGKMSLCGMTSETGENFISYHHNWFDHSDSRHPRVRTMTVHVYNNYFDGISKYGVGATTGSNVFVESNYFRNVNKPMMISLQGTDIANGSANATFSDESGGMIKAYGNYYAEKSSNFRLITHTASATSFDCYEASTRSEQVPTSYKTLSGNTIYNNFDTDNSKMYSYTADAAENIPGIVKGEFGAGRMQHGDFVWTFNNATDDASSEVNTGLKTAITNYASSLVSIQGESGSTGGDNGNGDNGGDNGNGGIEGAVVCTFTSAGGSNTAFTITGSFSKDKGSMTIDGTAYTYCLKMESSTVISFTISSPMTLTLKFGGTTAAGGKKVKVNTVSETTDANGTLTKSLAAGSHTIEKGDAINLFYISLQ